MMLYRHICVCLALGIGIPTFANDDDSHQPAPLHQRIDVAIAESSLGSLAQIASDAEFLRRSYLDLHGRSPTVAEVNSFLAETEPNKRAVLVDKLLGADEFNDFFAIVLDVMFLERRGGSRISQEEWKTFLRNAISAKQPFDQIVRSILSADGTGDSRGAAKFLLQRGVEPHALTRDVARTFLARDLQCAQCHDHPIIDDYSQAEYYGIFAFLNRSYLFEDPADGNKSYVGEKAEGTTEFKSVFFPDEDASQTIPRLLGGFVLEVEPRLDGEDPYVVAPSKETAAVPKFSRRGQLARLVTHPANEHFTKNSVNRLWAHMMGRGIVDPVDFHHGDNPPSHPQLLKILADEFVNLKFNIREFLRQIAVSETYQRSVAFPDEPTVSLAEIEREATTLSTAVTELKAASKSDDEEYSLFESRLSAERSKVARVDNAISDVCKRLDEHNKQQQNLKKASQDAGKQLTEKQQQLDALSVAVVSAKKVADVLPDDETLANAYNQYKERVDQLNKEVAGINQSIADNKQQSEALAKQLSAAKRKLAGLKSECVGLADMVAEARGALRVFDARRKKHESLLNERRRRLSSLDLYRDYLKKSDARRELAARLAETEARPNELNQLIAREDQLPAERESLLAKADQQQQELAAAKNAYESVAVETDLASARLRKSWERRFAVRSLKPLTPEQLAGSAITALGLKARFQLEAESEWANNHKDKEPAEIDDGKKQTEISALVHERVAQVESTFVTLFAAPAGAPQDVFSATVDQAMFLANDGQVQDWLSPAAGTLLKRLQSVDNPNLVAGELYLAILSRPATDTEKKTITEYLSQRMSDQNKAIQELAWGLLASLEFRFNY